MSQRSYITVCLEVPGVHYYPESTREYLKVLHRHDFKICVSLEVTDPNREFEFYDVQEYLRDTLDMLYPHIDVSTYNFGTRSCEHIAQKLFSVLRKKYPLFTVKVEEDKFNSSTVADNGDTENKREPVLEFYSEVHIQDFASNIAEDLIMDLLRNRGEWVPKSDKDKIEILKSWTDIIVNNIKLGAL